MRHLRSWTKLPEANRVKIVADMKTMLRSRKNQVSKIDNDDVGSYDDPAADDFLDFKVVSESEEEGVGVPRGHLVLDEDDTVDDLRLDEDGESALGGNREEGEGGKESMGDEDG